jgi:hypothetical protein
MVLDQPRAAALLWGRDTDLLSLPDDSLVGVRLLKALRKKK